MHQKMNSEVWDELWGMRWMLWCSSWWDPFCIKGFAVSPALKKLVRRERVSELKADLSSQAACFLDLSLHEYLFVFCWGLGTCNNNPMLQQELFCISRERALYASKRPHEMLLTKIVSFYSFLRILTYKSSRLLHNRNNHVTNVLPVHSRNSQKQEKSDFPMSCCEASWQESKPF
jgi:hypothetical protein